MGYHSPLAKLPIRQRAPRGSLTNPPIPNSDTIRLPDGRLFSVADLLKQVKKIHRVINLQTFLKNKRNIDQIVTANRVLKYTYEERQWLARAPVADIQARYNISSQLAARNLRDQSNYILVHHLHRDDPAHTS